jgi:2,3-bisphosphoglycerate-independent phosphoglycerate mutase
MKILFIILDGLGDRPIKELGNRTWRRPELPI